MSLTTQFYTMIAMVGMGGWLGAALDTYGRFLKRPLRARWVVFINDFLFWVVQGLILFYILLLVNKGELRIYIFLAVLCGYAAYQSLLKTIYLNLLEKIIKTSLSIYRFVVRLGQIMVVKPIIGLIHLIIAILLGTLNMAWKLLKWTIRIVYVIVKFLLAPVRFLLLLLWKFTPNKVKVFFARISKQIEGFIHKTKNIFGKIKAWWLRLKNKK